MRSAVKYQSWIQPVRHVGAVGQAAAAAQVWITTTDDAVRDVPVFEYAIELQDDLFSIADEIGVGDEVRTIVYSIRTFEYAMPVAVPLLVTASGAGAGAGASAITIAGGVAALGAVVVVASLAAALFGGGESDAEKTERKRAQQQVLHLRDRLTLSEFAEEQDEAASRALAMAGAFTAPVFAKVRAELLSGAALAQKLAKFYRAAKSRLDSDKRAAFESISNLSRWEGMLLEYEKLSWPQRDAINENFGKSAPRLPFQLKAPIAKEQAALLSILQRHQTGASVASGKLGTALLVASGAGLLYFLAPGLAVGAAAAIWTGTKRAGSYVTQKVKGD